MTRPASPARRRYRVVLAIGVVLAGFASAALLRPADPAASADLAAVGRGTVEDTVTALGKIQPRAHVDVGAQVSGQLMRLHVAVGQRVREGDLLAEIDPALQQAKVEAGRAERARLAALLAEQRARADFAQAQLARQTALRRAEAGRGEAYDQARMESRTAAAQVEATLGLGSGALVGLFALPVVFTATAIAGAVSCAVVTGLVFGLIPARRAARLDPVTALSSE